MTETGTKTYHVLEQRCQELEELRRKALEDYQRGVPIHVIMFRLKQEAS